jgi:two-component system chemotaxis response regulator CheB
MAVKKKAVTPRKKDPQPFLVCIGASAGGLNAVIEVVKQFPPNLPAAVCVVLHLSRSAIGEILVEKIRKNSKLKCQLATAKTPIKAGHVFIASPDTHLLVKQDHILIGRGPAENRFRPSIDVLFRSVAAAFAERSIGIILTGYLNDGAAGMWAIGQSGGHTIVQDPNEAEYPDMPLSVLDAMEVDYSIPLKDMGGAVLAIIKNKKLNGLEPPSIVIAESQLSEKAATAIENVGHIGEKTVYSCPDCGGGLWLIRGGPASHYRCHVGHSYSEEILLGKIHDGVEQTLWVALRMMEEKRMLMVKTARSNRQKGLHSLAIKYDQQSDTLQGHILSLKHLLFEEHRNLSTGNDTDIRGDN